MVGRDCMNEIPICYFKHRMVVGYPNGHVDIKRKKNHHLPTLHISNIKLNVTNSGTKGLKEFPVNVRVNVFISEKKNENYNIHDGTLYIRFIMLLTDLALVVNRLENNPFVAHCHASTFLTGAIHTQYIIYLNGTFAQCVNFSNLKYMIVVPDNNMYLST